MAKRNICRQTRSLALTNAAIILCSLALSATAALPQSQPQQNNPQQSGHQLANQQLPEAPQAQKPETQKDENAGPVVALEDDTKKAEEAAEEELLRARDWEATWISGVYLGKHQKMRALTKKQREEIYLRQTLTTPQAYMKRMFEAGFDQTRGVPSQWDDGWAGYAERFASREGQFITANSLAALGNAKLGYEVRYDRCKCSGAWPRIRHAIIRNFLTYNHTEREMRPQWALYGGAFGGGMVATSWKPSPKNAWANGGWAVVGQAGYGTLLNLVIEFSREINEKQGVK
ncbi:MAG: hypothetical protein WA824_02765 [Candidatus Sulfotelmatobacter sp.]